MVDFKYLVAWCKSRELTLTSIYRFQLGLAIVMKRKSSQNLQDTKLNSRCIEEIG